MIRLLRPEALLLAPLAVLVLRGRALSTRPATVLRSLLALLLVGIVADPVAPVGTTGRDLVLVLDRSRSVPASASASLDELADRAAREARPDDRWGVVTFGRDAVLEGTPRAGRVRAAPTRPVEADGTDLSAALDAALAAIPPDRPGSLVLVSDGEATGGDVEAAARRARRRGVRVDVVPLRRPGASDVAVEDVSVPGEVAASEPFQVVAWVRSEAPAEVTLRLLRDGAVVAEGRRTLRAGVDRVVFSDVVAEPGVHPIAVEVVGAADRVPENDRASAVVRVEGAFRVLCVTPDGRTDRLTDSLHAAGLELVVVAAERAPLTADALDGFRAVVLEDVPSGDLPAGGNAALARWVVEQGGGLLMTGGRASFGPGGYHRSPVGEVLPVSLEMRQEQRKFALAMAIVLDRSGSMAMPAGAGRTKMDLANQGACAAIDLLMATDAVTVIAVDSAPHRVVPLQPVRSKAAIQAQVLRIESMGGGIFTSTAVHAAAAELRDATQGTRHIVLFADAADAEEPGDLATFVPTLRKAGITVSVIGMGTDRDSDAAFLRDVASRGGGRIFFTQDVADLPRVFAQETIEVARSAVVEEPCGVAAQPDLVALGAVDAKALPSVGGYTIAYRKPDASVGLVTTDELRAPLLSFWQRGLGRCAAFLGQADGPLSGGLGTWGGYGELFATLVRWAAGTEASGDLLATAVRRGHEGVVVVEGDRAREDLLGRVEARVAPPDGEPFALDLVRTGPARLEGRFPLKATGAWRAAVGTGDGRFLRVAPLVLPYSPEFEPRAAGDGEATLRRVAQLTGGRVDPPAGTLYDGPRDARGFRSLASWLALAAIIVFLAEILVRRTGWTPRLARVRALVGRVRARLRPRAWLRPRAGAPTSPAGADAATVAAEVARRGADRRGDAGADDRASGGASPPPAPPSRPASDGPGAPPPPPGGIASVLDAARRRRPR
ncbi:MAG: VWA domain-containing protein [Planctomycetes bacterium]|nr:VWA domain-containing protein [Planctomycetota bacterium]